MSGVPTGLPRLTAGLDGRTRLALDEHLATHGPLPGRAADPAALITAVAAAGLRGRGGGGFPTGAKLEAVASAGRRPIVVANGSEGEPLSRKDRVLLEAMPHLVLDGALTAARALGAREVVVSAPERAATAIASLQAALTERADARRVRVLPVPGRYLAGEETALLRFAGGGPLKPTLTPPRPAERGLRGRPTLVQNVETLAHLALVARHGGAWFRAMGSELVPGSALVTLAGAVVRPGVYEIATGMALDALLDAAGGTTEPVRAVLVGGCFGRWRAAHETAGLALDAELGAGVIAVLGTSACPAAELARSVAWLAGQSARQCGPCVHGLAALAGAVADIASGRADDDAFGRLMRWGEQIEGRGACRHPDGVVRHLRSGLRVFAAELDDHHRNGPCAACDAPSLLWPETLEAAVA